MEYSSNNGQHLKTMFKADITSVIKNALLYITVLPMWLAAQSECAIFNRYYPPASNNAETVHVPRNLELKIELLASYGCSESMKNTGKQAIIKHFTQRWSNSGYESHYIGEEMEKHFGGLWMVGIYDIDYDTAYTIIRRSPSYMLFAANDRAILISKDGGDDKNKGRSII